jgi:hypothetical protein
MSKKRKKDEVRWQWRKDGEVHWREFIEVVKRAGGLT